ncbi:helix-turn-helix transcriptional regulator [Thermopolyspora sp. NPDC052614]|uniref:helix-turn-helix domain-containing protein n=1 Tax=Thermopolyspora sp. NPDC052614 TaxID=3155682 RepID=UPI0034460895
MISPYVRRLRLADEVRTLRTKAGLTQAQVAAKSGLSRVVLSQLENGHGVDQADIIAILDALGVDGPYWTKVMTIAREAAERGWWESNKAMGERQALFANLEAGAATIREFQMIFIPGLLQTPEFTAARIQADGLADRPGYKAGKAVEARQIRQRMLRRPDGPGYEVIIDEIAVRRRCVPADIMRRQLHHLTAVVHDNPNITVRVLPLEAEIPGYRVPRSAFGIYTFPDPEDPTVVTVDTVTDDLVLTQPAQVERYRQLYDLLREAAMPPADSLAFLREAAEEPTG